MEKGEAKKDWKIILFIIQVKYPTEFVIEINLPFTCTLYCE